MTGRGRARAPLAVLALTVALAVAVVAPSALPASADRVAEPPAPAHRARTATVVGPLQVATAQVDGLRSESRTTFTPRPADGRIDVEVVATLVNDRPDEAAGGFIRSFFMPEYGVPTVSEATDHRARTAEGTALPVSVEPTASELIDVAVVDLVPDLTYPDSVTFHLDYVIPALPPRAPQASRVNPAFVTFPAFGIGDPGHASIEVVPPAGFEVETIGDQMEEVERNGTTRFVAEAIEDPLGYTSFVVMTDDDARSSRLVEFPGSVVDVRAWPDDPEWAEFVVDVVERGVPGLEEVTGLTWPSGELAVLETVSPYLYGYAGWYTPDDATIEVGDELDAHVVLHELTHLWFNDRLFTDRWVNEGLAEELSTLALSRLGMADLSPEAIDASATGSLQLNTWSNPVFQDEVTSAQEAYGYNASWWVLRQVREEIGAAALSEVVRTAFRRETAFVADHRPERHDEAADWKRFLDLLALVGGSERAEELFSLHVVNETQRASLARRGETHADYERLVEAGAGWAPPWAVREELGRWHFDRAGDAMARSRDLLTRRERFAVDLGDLDVDAASVLASLEEDYERSGDLDELAGTFDDAEEAARALDEATDDVEGGFAPVRFAAQLGWGADDDLGRAVDALEDGEFGTAAARAEHAAGVAADAVWVALARVAAVAALLLAIAMAARVLGWPRRAGGASEDLEAPPLGAGVRLDALAEPRDHR